MKTCKFSIKNKWAVFLIIFSIVLAYPFLLQLISIIFRIEFNEKWTFNLSLDKFVNPWITMCSVFGAAIGLHQVQKKINLSKKRLYVQYTQIATQQKQHKEQLNTQYVLIATQQEQLKVQLQNSYRVRYTNCVEMLNAGDETVRLQAINNLYLLAKENPTEYLLIICNSFCNIINSNTHKYSQKEIQNVIKYLFIDEPRIFDQIRKNINNSNLTDLTITNAHINNTNFNNTIINNCKFHHSKITNSNFIGSTFKNTIFRTTQFKNSIFRKSILSDQTTFNRLNIDGTVFSSAKFNNTWFEDVHISNSDFSEAEILQSTFTKTHFVKCILDFGKINQTKLIFINSNYLNNFTRMLPNQYKVTHIEGLIVYIK